MKQRWTKKRVHASCRIILLLTSYRSTFVDLPSQTNKYIIRILNRTWTHFSFIRTAICSHSWSWRSYSFGVSGNACPLPREGKFSFLPNSFSFSILLSLSPLPLFPSSYVRADRDTERNSNHPVSQHFIISVFWSGGFLKKKSGNKDFKKRFQDRNLERDRWNEPKHFILFIWIYLDN